MRRLSLDRGEGSVSYIAVVLLVGVITLALVVTGIGGTITSAAVNAVCRVAQQDCSESGPDEDGQGTTADGGQQGQPGQPGRPQGGPQGQPQGQQGQPQVQPLGGQPLDYLQVQMAAPVGGGPGIGSPDKLPTGGPRPYVPPKNSHGKPKRVGGRGQKPGYIDKDGNKWEWDTKHKDHWDVQHKDGSHTNVFPDGRVRGEDNFGTQPNDDSGDEAGENQSDFSVDPETVKNGAIVVGGGLTLGAAIWWGAKILSPACGPFVVVCAVVL
ncbi:hypothetical protein [Actinomadura sp. HBU206391]|uniref:hypothetical protein n=1 Tax=Actinomadura sp. HBU206391 TaxID=2731692 RepID=UPI001650C7E6|nr:hypothetical protein [Actinomadura sp. HBU206391]MBC6456951.1 hypothetical protein [Actinomadura sp. HBU206391]